jgi:UDP-N-acetylmuramoyl-tripeptide--D-alanyl-D-alanine ligase
MVMNLALVVHTALTLGVPRESLQICLDGWRTYRQRGEVLRYANRQYYVDCYNANPLSMLDSLECFEKLFAESRHLYVIGGMNELGACAEEWHQQTVRKMPLKEDSCVAFVGPWAEAMQAALLERDWDAAKVSCHEVSESVRPLLEKFSGTVFLKGSRAYSLETLVEEGAVRC